MSDEAIAEAVNRRDYVGAVRLCLRELGPDLIREAIGKDAVSEALQGEVVREIEAGDGIRVGPAYGGAGVRLEAEHLLGEIEVYSRRWSRPFDGVDMVELEDHGPLPRDSRHRLGVVVLEYPLETFKERGVASLQGELLLRYPDGSWRRVVTEEIEEGGT